MDSPFLMMTLATYKHNKSRVVAASTVAFCTLLSACAGRSLTPPSSQAVQVVSLAAPLEIERTMPSAMLISQLAATNLSITDFPVPGAQRATWRARLRRAENLARQGQAGLAQQRVAELRVEVAQVSERYFQQQAQRYLKKAENFALLKRREQDQLRAALFAYETEDYQQAYRLSQALYRKLWSAQAWVTVKPGDTLASLAARVDVFDNPNLWPLLQKANKGLVRHPQRLKIGWRLMYPVYPTLDEVFAAAQIATQ